MNTVAHDHELFSSTQGPGPERLLALNGVGMLLPSSRSSGIAEMIHQFAVHPDQRDLLRAELDPDRPAVRGNSLLVRRFAQLPIRWIPR